MWTQERINEIVEALRHLPADRLLQARDYVVSLKEQYGHCQPIEECEDWSEEDLREATVASLNRLDQQDSSEEEHG